MTSWRIKACIKPLLPPPSNARIWNSFILKCLIETVCCVITKGEDTTGLLCDNTFKIEHGTFPLKFTITAISNIRGKNS